jgi:CheY-like chemotaxis protein
VAELLLVDDEAPVRKFFVQVLEGAGYRVVEASSGKEALRRLQERPFDLVITDILMPDMDGLELTKVLHHRFPDIKIVVISGDRDDMDYCHVARFLGAHVTLAKPVPVQLLLETVARQLGKTT